MNGLEFSVDWVEGSSATPEERATACQLKIACGSEFLTQVEDLRARSVRPWVRVSAYPLALWFAANWWRLLYEPSKPGLSSTDWRLSHELPGAGHGYVWPNVTLASDGEWVQIVGRASTPTEFEAIRFIGNASGQLPAPSVAKSLGEFIELVLLRLDQFELPDTELRSLWHSIGQERADPQQAFLRRIEARLGYDAECAESEDSETLPAFERLAALSGRAAAEEIATIFNSDIGGGVGAFESLASGPGLHATRPLPRAEPPTSTNGATPWEIGHRRARWARDALGLTGPVIEDAVLAEIFDVSDVGGFVQSRPASSLPLGLAVRGPTNRSLKLVFRTWRRVGRRFEAARFLCESVSAPVDDLWLPSTDAATARQRIQRAFAAEFLMPIEQLALTAGPGFSAEAIEDAAEWFGVSPLAARSHLANNNLIARF